MSWLAARLGLSPVELDLLWLLAAIELDPRTARLADVFGGATHRRTLTTQIVRRLIAVTSADLEHLRDLALIEIDLSPGVPQQQRSIRVVDRVIDLARGEVALSGDLRMIAALHPQRGLQPSSQIATIPAYVLATGPTGSGRTTCVAAAAGELGYGTLRIGVSKMAQDDVVRDAQLRAVLREACLFDVMPVFQELTVALIAQLDDAARVFTTPIFATAEELLRWPGRSMRHIAMQLPDAKARAQMWAAQLADADPQVVARGAAAYRLRPGAIVGAARSASTLAGDDAVSIEHIHEGVRVQLGEELAGLATRIDWRQTWDDLVIPTDQFEQIIELVARVRHRTTVLDTWGFGAKVGKGSGVTALMSGPPGTGKTMVAGLIAQELGLDLFQVDVSRIVSKYIGETEKQLAKLFDAAESGHAVLLFDEADSLFAKRSAVKSSNDRYANMEVNFLLQRIESFTGVCLLTTNNEAAIDEAFRRRLAAHVRFPMPDEPQRQALWKAMLPEDAPVAADLQLSMLAERFEMSGGYIKNAVLRAAYLAAERGQPIGPSHLLTAARAEYEAIGKVAFEVATS